MAQEPHSQKYGAAAGTTRDSPLSVVIASSVSALESLKGDYEQLHETAANTSPFALHDWHVAWCSHFLNIDAKIKDRLCIMIVRNAANACVAIAPLVASRRRIGPLGIVSVATLGIDPFTTEHRAPLILYGYERPASDAVRQRLAQEMDWHWISWGDVDSVFGDALAAGAAVRFYPGPDGYLIDLAPSWELFRAGLKRNIRESLRHCYNSLKRNGHEFAFEIVAAPAAVDAAIATFLRLHAMRAQSPGSVIHADHFANPISRRFLYDVCMRLAMRGVLRIFQLRIGGAVVASRIGFVVGDSLYLYYSGFDPAWGRHSVMTTTVAEAVKYAIAQGLKTVNLSRGSDVSKSRWGPRRIEYRSAIERPGSMVARIACHTYASVRYSKGLHPWLLRHLVNVRRDWS